MTTSSKKPQNIEQYERSQKREQKWPSLVFASSKAQKWGPKPRKNLEGWPVCSLHKNSWFLAPAKEIRMRSLVLQECSHGNLSNSCWRSCLVRIISMFNIIYRTGNFNMKVSAGKGVKSCGIHTSLWTWESHTVRRFRFRRAVDVAIKQVGMFSLCCLYLLL